MTDETIPCPRDITTAALAKRQDQALRLWLIARHLDRRGSGHVPAAAVADFCEQHGIASGRQVAQTVDRGAARGWWEVSGRGELYLASTARVFDALGATCETTVAVELPLASFSGLERWRATLYSSYFMGRQSGMFSRAHLVNVFRHTDRTLARWERVADVKAEPCIATAPIHGDRPLPWSIGAAEGYTGWYQCRRCGFKTRHAGALDWHYSVQHPTSTARGLPSQAWAARRLPNRYSTTHLTRVRIGCLRVIRGIHSARSSAHTCSLSTSGDVCGQGTGHGSGRVTGERDIARVFVVIDRAGRPGTSGATRAAGKAARIVQAGGACFLDTGRRDGVRVFQWCAVS